MSKKAVLEAEKSKLPSKQETKIVKNFGKRCLFSEAETKPGSTDKPQRSVSDEGEGAKIEDHSSLVLVLRKIAVNPQEVNNL